MEESEKNINAHEAFSSANIGRAHISFMHAAFKYAMDHRDAGIGEVMTTKQRAAFAMECARKSCIEGLLYLSVVPSYSHSKVVGCVVSLYSMDGTCVIKT
jgi:hypothetical protein